MVDFVREKYKCEGEHVRIRTREDKDGKIPEWVRMQLFESAWQRYEEDTPNHLILAAGGRVTLIRDDPYKKVRKILHNWGYQPDEPLGIRGQGITEPVEAVIRGGNPMAGLGAAGRKRKAASGREPKSSTDPKMRGTFIDGKFTVGEPCLNGTFKRHALDVGGKPTREDELVEWAPQGLRHVTKWKDGIAGIAEATFPHPERWRLADITATLDYVSVKEMTRAFARREATEPNCKKRWEGIFGKIDWKRVAARYKQGLLAPTDYGTHYKCVAHRGFCTRSHKPTESGNTMCRLCGCAKETVEHFGECIGLAATYKSMRLIDRKGDWKQPTLNLLGVGGGGGGEVETLERGVSDVHMFIWKEMIGEIARVDLKGQRYVTANVLRRAKARCLTRMQAFEQGVENYTQQKISKGENPQRGYENYQRRVKGIMSLDEEDGSISIDENMQTWLDSIEDSKDQDVRIVAAPEEDRTHKKARTDEYTPMFQPLSWPTLEVYFVPQGKITK